MFRVVITLAPLLLAAAVTRAAGPPAADGSVIRTQFTSAIAGAEPRDNLTELNDGEAERIYCFTELENLTGQVLVHRWEYRGEVMSKRRFRVDGAHARVWSSRLLTPDRSGSWTVVIMTASGQILAERTLDYNPGDPAFQD